MHRYLATRDEVRAVLEARGEPRYRADQVFDGLWTQRRPLESLTNIGERTAQRPPIRSAPRAHAGHRPAGRRRHDGEVALERRRRRPGRDRADALPRPRHGLHLVAGGVRDGLHVLRDRASRLRPAPRRRRDLRAGPPRAARFAAARRATSSTWAWANRSPTSSPCSSRSTRLHGDAGFSARHLTVSTVGVVPGMHRLREFPLPVTLAVSLHAPDDALRAELVPLNRRYPIAEVLDAAREYAEAKGRRVTFEYACIAGRERPPAPGRRLGRPAPRASAAART